MKKFNVLILLLIFFSCLSVSFAANEDSNSTLSTDTNHVTELTDNNDNIQQFMKTDSEVETANNKQAVSNESIAKTATTTSTNHTYVRPKSYVLLNASVKDANNKVVNEGQVYFKINNSILKDTNNKTILANVNKGFAQVKYYVGLTPTDDYNLTAIFKGSANYKMSTADNIFTVHKNKTNLRVFINPSSVVSGKKMNLTAIITREDNVTVNGGKVAFKLNENTIRDNKGNPIYARLVSGKATIETSIPVGTSAKEYYLMATYSGTTDNEETKSYSEGTRTYNEIFYVLKDDVNVVLSPYNNTVEWGEKIKSVPNN